MFLCVSVCLFVCVVCFCLCVYVHVHASLRVYVHAGIICVQESPQEGRCCPHTHHQLLWAGSLTVSSVRLHWVTSKPQGSSCLCLSTVIDYSKMISPIITVGSGMCHSRHREVRGQLQSTLSPSILPLSLPGLPHKCFSAVKPSYLVLHFTFVPKFWSSNSGL